MTAWSSWGPHQVDDALKIVVVSRELDHVVTVADRDIQG